MSNQRSIDSKHEEFRKYLENAGVNDTLTRIFTMIMESKEQISDPLQFIRDKFEKSSPVHFEHQMASKYLETARERVAMLEAENAMLKQELESYKGKYASKSSHSSTDK